MHETAPATWRGGGAGVKGNAMPHRTNHARPAARVVAVLRGVAVLGGALMLVAGCVPAEPYYGDAGYATGPAYAPSPYAAPGPYYGGSAVFLYGGGGYRGDHRYDHRDGRDHRGDWHGGGHSSGPWPHGGYGGGHPGGDHHRQPPPRHVAPPHQSGPAVFHPSPPQRPRRNDHERH